MPDPANNPLKLFYCYAHEDKALRDALDSHLAILKRQKLIEIWYDGQISLGVKWEDEVDKRLGSADIVLLLVSAAFLASDYCYSKEMMLALERHDDGLAYVIPIILRPVDWENAPFSKLRVLPTKAKAVTSWGNRDEAYEDIARGLHEITKELLALREASARKCFHEGIALKEQRQYEEAIVAFDRTIRLDPNDAFAYNSKGIALKELKRYEEAIAAFDQAIR